MRWEEHTIDTIKNLYNDESYKAWSDSIQDGAINEFSNKLNDLLRRLSGIVISEFEVNSSEQDKIIKIMELAAIAGKQL